MKAIETLGLTKRFKDKLAVNGLSLSVERGELFALLGVNGAGKTTTIKMLSGLLAPTEGDALILGRSIVKEPEWVKERINVSPQETAVAPNLSVRENLEFIADIYHGKKAAGREKADRLLSDLGLTGEAERKAKTLSGGMQRRLSIAMALISDPELLFLDEPTLGLDVLARRELWSVINSLKAKMTVILTTHYMEEAEALSDRVGIMAHGSLCAVGTAAELIEKTNAASFEDAFIRLAAEGGKAI